MKPEAVAEQIRQNANENLSGALKGLKEADGKMSAIANLGTVSEQKAGILTRVYENCRKELERVSKLSQMVLDDVPRYLMAFENGDSEGMQKCLQRIADADSEIEECSPRVRGFKRRLNAIADKIEGAG